MAPSNVPSMEDDKRAGILNFVDPSTSKIPEFHYEPLANTHFGVRFLRIFPGRLEDHVICELFEAVLRDQMVFELPLPENYAKQGSRVQYEALSWSWGKSRAEHQIHVRKDHGICRLKVSRDLIWALKHLRRPHEDRILWIDAICINQLDNIERNHQVENMAVLYDQASNVCVWLGRDNEESKMAIEFIKNEIMQFQNFDELCERKENTNKWKALLSLMQRSWFSRRWVVQEIALSRKATIHCGADTLDWKHFAIAVELFVEVETATHRLSEVMKKDPKYYHVPGWFEYVSELGASLLVHATSMVFRDYKSDSSANADGNPQHNTPSNRRPLLTLEYLVSSLSIFDATEPRDAIYALLAIAKDTTPLAVDLNALHPTPEGYARQALGTFTERKMYPVHYDQPYEDVCKDFIEFCLKHSDPSRALDIICRPWALAPNNKAVPNLGSTTSVMPLPSWVPQLSGAPFDMMPHAGMQAMKMGRKNADPLVGLPILQKNYDAGEGQDIDRDALRFVKRANHYSMFVKGFILDTVAKVEVPSQGGGIPEEWLKLAGYNPSANESEVPEEFWRTLVADRGKDERNPPMYYAKACKESITKGGYQSGMVNTSDLIHNERNSIVAQFCRRVQAVIWNRRLMKTDSANLGLGNKQIQCGDKVYILYGCSVPVILRETVKEEADMKAERDEDLSRAVGIIYRQRRGLLKAKESRKRKWDEMGEQQKQVVREDLRKWNEKHRDEQEVEKAHANWMKMARALPRRNMPEDEGKGFQYQFIGECYLHGMMDGEAMEVRNNKKIAPRIFEIR
ncbi:heterokaryon incompatibility protein-domain-containing protein [Tricladium varicosporioides]|nr:heterokaryon incompatibility protein-domain-containing protein [Hymenoscyphus varicosporioides]